MIESFKKYDKFVKIKQIYKERMEEIEQSRKEELIRKRTKEQPPMDKGEHDKDFIDA